MPTSVCSRPWPTASALPWSRPSAAGNSKRWYAPDGKSAVIWTKHPSPPLRFVPSLGWWAPRRRSWCGPTPTGRWNALHNWASTDPGTACGVVWRRACRAAGTRARTSRSTRRTCRLWRRIWVWPCRAIFRYGHCWRSPSGTTTAARACCLPCVSPPRRLPPTPCASPSFTPDRCLPRWRTPGSTAPCAKNWPSGCGRSRWSGRSTKPWSNGSRSGRRRWKNRTANWSPSATPCPTTCARHCARWTATVSFSRKSSAICWVSMGVGTCSVSAAPASAWVA